MNLAQLISLSIVVILIENLILEKALGGMRFPRLTRGRRAFITTALVMAALMLPAAALAWLIDAAAGRLAVLVLIPAAAAGVGIVTLRRNAPSEKSRQFRIPGYRLTVCAVNCIPLGLWQLLLTDLYSRGLAVTLLGALAAAAVMVLTGIVYESLWQRLRLCDCPARLRGLPMEIITAALLVMAVWGLA